MDEEATPGLDATKNVVLAITIAKITHLFPEFLAMLTVLSGVRRAEGKVLNLDAGKITDRDIRIRHILGQLEKNGEVSTQLFMEMLGSIEDVIGFIKEEVKVLW